MTLNFTVLDYYSRHNYVNCQFAYLADQLGMICIIIIIRGFEGNKAGHSKSMTEYNTLRVGCCANLIFVNLIIMGKFYMLIQ